MTYNTLSTCSFCNSVIFEDDTAESCAGECDRQGSVDEDYEPLNFDQSGDEVMRELPDPSDIWSTPPEEDFSDLFDEE